ncbi:hypothetical protein BT67DRAFT_402468, partial [Trichocladium antarcticum]
MDILLTLPIASYFLSSAPTSWSTSLNIFFFYITWSTLVLSHSALKIEIIGTTALRIALWLAPSLFFLAFDTLLPSLAKTIKHNGASALPPRSAKTLAKLVGLALLNLGLETALEAAISHGLATVLKTPLFRTSTTLPPARQMATHLGLLLAARELLTYAIHRHLLHGHPLPAPFPRTVTRLAALHTTHAHRARAPAPSLAAKTDHPLPHLLHRFAPLYLPAAALSLALPARLHLLTYLLFAGAVALEETLTLSGYAVVPGVVMGGVARRTAAHYATRGRGCFGTWGLLDWLLG